ncbi:MAG: hypothetical protein Q3971_01980 [Moraxella sp.]|nr:hypothetical protein [Moraxella sp.]
MWLRCFLKLMAVVVLQVAVAGYAHSATCNKTLKGCPPECKMIMNQIYTKMNAKSTIDGEKGVKQRYYELLFDEHGLSANKKTKDPRYGSWNGHVKKYNEVRGELAVLVNQASSSRQCRVYVTKEMESWVAKSAPTQTNRPEAIKSGYITLDKIDRLKKLGKLK